MRNLVLATVFVGACISAYAQKTTYPVGASATPQEIEASNRWDPISMDGKGLPAGSGTADVGEKIYAQKCVACHGPNGRGGLAPNLILSKEPTPANGHKEHVFPTSVPFTSALYDYIHRAMPMLTGPGTLKPDEVYSLVAFLLYKNEVIKQDEVMNAQTLPKVQLPNTSKFVAPVVKPLK